MPVQKNTVVIFTCQRCLLLAFESFLSGFTLNLELWLKMSIIITLARHQADQAEIRREGVRGYLPSPMLGGGGGG
jgi:hypothetical protein